MKKHLHLCANCGAPLLPGEAGTLHSFPGPQYRPAAMFCGLCAGWLALYGALRRFAREVRP